MRPIIDLTGQRFGRLLVKGRATPTRIYRNKQALWICVCDCGGQATVASAHLRNGHTQSCGCYCREVNDGFHTTHGHCRERKSSAEYIAWCNMKARCTNERRAQYEDYGGRGISVCDSWVNSFETFVADMGKRPSPQHTLERRDNNGRYEPSNCCWATKSEQAFNRRPKSL
jgi:hypothetical protein